MGAAVKKNILFLPQVESIRVAAQTFTPDDCMKLEALVKKSTQLKVLNLFGLKIPDTYRDDFYTFLKEHNWPEVTGIGFSNQNLGFAEARSKELSDHLLGKNKIKKVCINR